VPCPESPNGKSRVSTTMSRSVTVTFYNQHATEEQL
jgi:hypothetical protein